MFTKALNLAVGVLIFLSLIGLLVAAAAVFRRFVIATSAVWLLLPAFAYCADRYAAHRDAPRMRIVLIALAVLLSISAFVSRHEIRDYLGYRFIDGYSVGYKSACCDENGDEYVRAVTSANSWRAKAALACFEWVLLIPCIAVPATTYNRLYGRLARLQSNGAS